jgi:hypothetical protein
MRQRINVPGGFDVRQREGGISPRDSFARLYRSMALAYSSLCSLLIMATTLGPPDGHTPARSLVP